MASLLPVRGINGRDHVCRDLNSDLCDFLVGAYTIGWTVLQGEKVAHTVTHTASLSVIALLAPIGEVPLPTLSIKDNFDDTTAKLMCETSGNEKHGGQSIRRRNCGSSGGIVIVAKHSDV